MKNVTVTLDERTASWARREAARHGMSVSRFIGELLESRMGDTRRYNEAMRRFLSKAPYVFKSEQGRYATREELHARSDLR